ncbi:MAG: DUF4131 domain-containing protein, partial [Pseudomonadota bacterium]
MSIALTHRARPSWLAGQIGQELDNGRFPLLLPAFAIVGVWAVVEGPVAARPLLIGLAVAALFALRALAGRQRRLVILAPLALGLAAVAAGAFAAALQMMLAGTLMLERATTAAVTGRIEAAAPLGPKRQRIVIAVEEGLAAPMPKRVRLTVASAERFAVGTRVGVRGRLFPIKGPVMPGAYDPARRLYFDGIGATGFAYGPPQELAPPDGALDARIDALRQAVVARIVAADVPAGAFAVALLVGE